jgi:hypothetical protein
VGGHIKKASVTQTTEAAQASDPASTLRPSSARRLDNMRALVAEFAARDIGYAGVALLLACSLTTARKYIAELLDAGLVFPLSASQRRPGAGIDRTLYRRTADPLAVHRFLATLAGPSAPADIAAPRTRPDAARIHRTWLAADVSLRAGHAPARRDPLVAALFGAV